MITIIIYQFLNLTTIFSGLPVSYIVDNKTKNTMFGPPTMIVQSYERTKRISFNFSGGRGEKERYIKTIKKISRDLLNGNHIARR